MTKSLKLLTGVGIIDLEGSNFKAWVEILIVNCGSSENSTRLFLEKFGDNSTCVIFGIRSHSELGSRNTNEISET